MNKDVQIKYLKHSEIDIARWDLCIRNSLNGLPYAFSWYLDRMAGTWDALVMGDYLFVMPLPTGRKMGIRYLLQPIFTQQLGIFSPFEISPELVHQFLMSIPDRFRYICLNLNYRNYPGGNVFAVKRNINYQISLSPGYDAIAEGYSQNAKRNLKKSERNGLQVFQMHNIPEFILFFRQSLNDKIIPVNDKEYAQLQLLVSYAISTHCGVIMGVYSSTNTLCAAVFFLRSMGRHFYLIAASNREGLEQKAMFFLVDHYIRNHAGREEYIDFEGSNHEGIARFYAGFGGTPVHYYTVKRNRLFWPLRLLKR